MAIGEYVPNLKPCPFCGEPPGYSSNEEENSNGRNHFYVSVGCADCGFQMEAPVAHHDRAETLFFQEAKGTYTAWYALSFADKIDWERRAANRNASYDIEGYKLIEERWNRRTP